MWLVVTMWQDIVMHTSLRHNIKQVKRHILFQHGASDCQWNFTNSDSRWSRLINCCQSGVLHLPTGGGDMTYVVMHTSLWHNIKQVKRHILFQHGASDCQWNSTNSDSRWSRLINCCQSGVLHLPDRRWRHDMHDIRCHAHKPTTQYQASEMCYFNLTWSIARPMKFHIISHVSGYWHHVSNIKALAL